MNKAIIVVSRKAPYYIVSELEILAQVAGYESTARVYIRPRGQKHRLTEAKIDEIRNLFRELGATHIIVQPDLPPSDILALRKNVGAEVLDRTMLLLEVFEKNAGSREAKLQIQAARMRHELPLLRELVNQAKRGELPGFLAGGAYAIDRHYRHMRKKVAEYSRTLEKIRLQRDITRKRRRTTGFTSIAIVGYANAGKTTLFNNLTGNRKETGTTPFTTITPKVAKSRRGRPLVYTDTVGFVSNVPAEIIDAFHATLEEITSSDMILYVLDFSEPVEIIERRLSDSFETLRKIGVINKPMVMLFNKADKLAEGDLLEKTVHVRKKVLNEYTAIAAFVIGSAKDDATPSILEEVLWSISNQRSLLSGSVTDRKEIKELLATSR